MRHAGLAAGMRRILGIFVAAASLVGCGDNAAPTTAAHFDTITACFEDRFASGFSPQRGIELCCVTNPIGQVGPGAACGDTPDQCVSFVTPAISTGAATADEIVGACNDYLIERLHPQQ